jgi:hypothetical protein
MYESYSIYSNIKFEINVNEFLKPNLCIITNKKMSGSECYKWMNVDVICKVQQFNDVLPTCTVCVPAVICFYEFVLVCNNVYIKYM